MRISHADAELIKKNIISLTNCNVRVWLFGSRIDDDGKGGDIDLLLKMDQPVLRPAQLSNTIIVKLMRQFNGRKIDVVLEAPNLDLKPIHAIAKQTGVEL